jgi:hypothetical protein
MAAEGIGASDGQPTNNCTASSSRAEIITPKEARSPVRAVSAGVLSPGANTFLRSDLRFGYEVSSNNPAARIRKIVSDAQYNIVNTTEIFQINKDFDIVLENLIAEYSKASSEQVKKEVLADIKEVLSTYIGALTKTGALTKIFDPNAAQSAFKILNEIMEIPYFDPAIKGALLSRIFESHDLADLLFYSLPPGAAQNAFGDLVYKDEDGSFKSLDPKIRFSLLSEINNNPNERTIHYLTLLAKRLVSTNQSLEDQLRSVSLIALAIKYGDKETTDKTLDFLLPQGGPQLIWGDLERGVDYITCGQYEGDVGAIVFNRYSAMVVTGDLTHLARSVGTHETYHAKKNNVGDGSFDDFKGEFWANYYGFKNEHHGKPPSLRDAFTETKWLITKGYYDEIAETFITDCPASRQMVDFIIKAFNLDPKITADEIRKLDPKSLPNDVFVLSPKEMGYPADEF